MRRAPAVTEPEVLGDPAIARERAASLEAAGDLVGAIEILHAANRVLRDPGIEAELVRLRHDAFFTIDPGPREAWPPELDDPFPRVRDTPPEIAGEELTATVLGGAIRHHGALLVRGLVPPDRVAQLRADIDTAFAAREARDEPDAVWYRPFAPSRPSQFFNDALRAWNRDSGAMWAADSPRALFDVIDTYKEIGLGAVIAGYLGEPPALSVNKCTIRRVGASTWPSWHQDGSFIPGDEIRTVDVWLSLSDCGGGTTVPGLDLVPRRLEFLAETGGEGALTTHGVGLPEVQRVAGDTPIVRPTFAPGDALLFDEQLLHCTGVDAQSTGERYAIEAWFFARSCFPSGYVPFVF